MAEDKLEQRPLNWRQLLPWTVLFRGFQIALDPKKLVLAAGGIVVMSLAWWVLAVIFFNSVSEPDENKYSPTPYIQEGVPQAEAENRARRDYLVDRAKWELMARTAGPKSREHPDWGQLRTLPFFEDRGPNPFLLVTGQAGTAWTDDRAGALTAMGAYLVEPLVKFLSPVVYLLHPEAGFVNRLYFLLVIVATLATWAVFGAAITRIAVVQVARGEKIRLTEALKFVLRHYLSYFSAPLFPLGLVALMLVGLILFGIIGMVPILGEILYGLLWPLVLVGCLAMAVILVGLVGWPLMYTTISAEGSDAFDGISRSYSYVYQSPWNFLGYSAVALAYGAILVFFVGFMGSLTVYLARWGVDQGTFVRQRDPSFLCVYAPTSFGWRDLLLAGARLQDGTPVVVNGQVDPATYNKYLEEFRGWNYIGAFLVGVSLWLFFLMILGFAYSYFWSACSIIYLLLRRRVDDTDLDEVYLEEDEDEVFGSTEEPAKASTAAVNTGPSLTMVEAPSLRSSVPPPSPPPSAPLTPSAPATAPATESKTATSDEDGESKPDVTKTE